MTDYNLWKNDITNRFPSHTSSHVIIGSGFTAKAVVTAGGAQVAISSFHMSLWDAYLDLREKLNKGDKKLLPQSTTAQRDALVGIVNGTKMLNITTKRQEVLVAGVWEGAGGQMGGHTHLPESTLSTTNNAQTTISAITLSDNSVYGVEAEILAETPDHTTIADFFIQCTVKRTSGGGAVIVGVVSNGHVAKDSGAASWNVTFTVSGNDVRVSVTGANGTNINWECDLSYLKY